MRKWLLTTAVVALAGAASAQTAPAPPPDRKLSVTIYNSDLALVEDARTLAMTAGRQRLEFKDVSPQIRAETVSLSAPGIGIVEQNFDYDLLSPDVLMEKAVGQQVKIVRTNPATGVATTEVATVLAVNEGVVLKIGDRIEVLRDDGLPTRVIFDKVPENLRARPTLSVTVNAAAAGPRQTRLSYLTSGLGWKADYVALFDEKAGKLDLNGWVTLTNTSGTSYEAADVQLVAGRVSQVGRPTYGGRPSGTGTQTGQGALADYYLYPLPERTTIAQNQTKQVSFLDVQGAPAKKIYRADLGGFTSMSDPASAGVFLQFVAGSGQASSRQMPAGVIRVYVRDAEGNPKFIGENNLSHTPAGSDLSVRTGDAFDVTYQSTIVSTAKVSSTVTRYEMKYVLRNARAEPVTVNLRQDGLQRRARIIRESQQGVSLDADTRAWDVVVPGNGETTLTLEAENGW